MPHQESSENTTAADASSSYRLSYDHLEHHLALQGPPSMQRMPILWSNQEKRVRSPNDVTDKSLAEQTRAPDQSKSATKMPFKKRMKFEKPTTNKMINISPISLYSATEKSAPLPSYDSKDDNTSVDSSSSEVIHFPVTLHSVLGLQESQDVLQWLAHGKSFKVLHWEKLCNEVIPRHFPSMGDVSANGFLYQLKAWGFQEIAAGPDAGAFTHHLFRKSLPNLCREMKYRDTSMVREVLKVPSLSSNSQDHQHSAAAVVVRVPLGWPLANHNNGARRQDWTSAAYSPLQMPYGHSSASNRAPIPTAGIQSGRGRGRPSATSIRSGRGAGRSAMVSSCRLTSGRGAAPPRGVVRSGRGGVANGEMPHARPDAGTTPAPFIDRDYPVSNRGGRGCGRPAQPSLHKNKS